MQKLNLAMLLAFVVALLLAIFQMVAKVVLVRPLYLYNSGFMASIRIAAAPCMPCGLTSDCVSCWACRTSSTSAPYIDAIWVAAVAAHAVTQACI